MIERWNERVGPGDAVVHLGAFALASRERASELVASLAGYKVLLFGNHDRSATAMRACGFDEVHKEYEAEGIRCVHDPEDACAGETTLCGHVHGPWRSPDRPDGARVVNVGVDVGKKPAGDGHGHVEEQRVVLRSRPAAGLAASIRLPFRAA